MPNRQPDAKIESESFFKQQDVKWKSNFYKKNGKSTTEIENCSNPTPLHPDSVQIVIIEQGK